MNLRSKCVIFPFFKTILFLQAKMVVFCVVPGCGEQEKSKRKKENEGLEKSILTEKPIRFHCIPKNPDLRSKWLGAIFISNEENSEYERTKKTGARVCSKHFDPSDYSISCGTYERLLPNALPKFESRPYDPQKSTKFNGSNQLNIHNHAQSTRSLSTTLTTNEKNDNAIVIPRTSAPINDTYQSSFKGSISTTLMFKEQPSDSAQSLVSEVMETNMTICQSSSSKTAATYSTAKHQLTFMSEESTQTPNARISFMDKSTQASPIIRKRSQNKKKVVLTRKLGKQISRLKGKILKMQEKINKNSGVMKELKNLKKDDLYKQVKLIEEDSSAKENLKAQFLLEQILAYGKNTKPYLESTLKICCLLFKKSPCAYSFLRDMNIVHLPHRTTLKRFIGHSSGEEGITKCVKERLKAEFNKLTNEHEKLASLIFDEMAIKAKLLYDRNLDRFWGETTLSASEGVGENLATHLLCFILQGLSSNYRIPVGYFFTAKLNSIQLHSIILQVLEAVESSGFIIVRMVADNAKINTSAFKLLCGGSLTHEAPHPHDPSRKIFLAFDQSHIIKNVRSQFLSRQFMFIGLVIKSDFLKTLYHIQKGSLIRPVRFLTRKVLYPSSFEKMNVLRAVQVFSEEVTSAMKTVLRLHMCDFQEEENLEATIYFMEMVRKWYFIHDVSNQTKGIHSRNDDKKAFYDVGDDRLQWLLDEFLPYLEIIQSNATNDVDCLTKETYEAIQITTKSTVELVRYLINSGFHYVLTRKFSSDIVEAVFSHIRSSGGYNDQMDARACTLSLEHSIKIGILKASADSNVSIGKVAIVKAFKS